MCTSFKWGSGEVLTHCPRRWPLSGVCNKQEICPRRGRDHNANAIDVTTGTEVEQSDKTEAVKCDLLSHRSFAVKRH